MAKIKDYKCRYSNYTGIQEEFVNSLGLKLPDMYHSGADMAAYAKAVKDRDGGSYCKLPFDTAVEGEALGAVLKYDNSPLGPRPDGYLLSDPKEILELPDIDPEKGRMAEILKACDMLRAEGCKTTIEVRGLFDTLNALMDIQNVFMFWATDKAAMQEICDKIRRNLICWIRAAKDHCDLLFYSDGSGGVNVIGPRLAKQLVNWFVYPLMKEVEEILKGGPALWMCPKTAFMLIGTEQAQFKPYPVDADSYIEAAVNLPDEIRLLGQRCTRELDRKVDGQIYYLNLV